MQAPCFFRGREENDLGELVAASANKSRLADPTIAAGYFLPNGSGGWQQEYCCVILSFRAKVVGEVIPTCFEHLIHAQALSSDHSEGIGKVPGPIVTRDNRRNLYSR
jgi:hypothetical protein